VLVGPAVGDADAVGCAFGVPVAPGDALPLGPGFAATGVVVTPPLAHAARLNMATRIPSVGITCDRMPHKTAARSISPPSKRAYGRFGDARHISPRLLSVSIPTTWSTEIQLDEFGAGVKAQIFEGPRMLPVIVMPLRQAVARQKRPGCRSDQEQSEVVHACPQSQECSESATQFETPAASRQTVQQPNELLVARNNPDFYQRFSAVHAFSATRFSRKRRGHVTWAEFGAMAEIGQFIAIAGALFVAYFQLRHLRRQQEAALIQSIFADLNSEIISGALDFVYTELPVRLTSVAYVQEIAEGRATAASHRELIVMHFFNGLGLLLHSKMVREYPIILVVASPCVRSWDKLAPVVELMRRQYPHAYTPYEALVGRARTCDFSSVNSRFRSESRHLQKQWTQTACDLADRRISLLDDDAVLGKTATK
jgi:hypothetical protein